MLEFKNSTVIKKFDSEYNSKNSISHKKLGSVENTNKFFEFKGDNYISLQSEFRDANNKLLLPRVTGMTPFSYWEKIRGYKCVPTSFYHNVINSNIHVKEQPIAVVGGFGTGKSLLIIRSVNNYLALGYHAFTFCDMFNEVRHHRIYGFYPEDSNEFIPFRVRYLIPKGYKFKRFDLDSWDRRNNVFLQEYSSIQELVKWIMKDQYTVNAIYSECYSQEDLLKIFVLIYEYLREYNLDRESGKNACLFFHHEISQLFPQNQTAENHHLLNLASDRFLEFRKNGIQIFVAMQLPQELFYRIGLKFPHTINFKQYYSSDLAPAKKDTLYYELGQCNIEENGFYTRHYFSQIAELKQEKLISSGKFDLIDLLTPEELKIVDKINERESKELKKFRNSLIRKGIEFLSTSDLSLMFNLSIKQIQNILKISESSEEEKTGGDE